MKPFLGENFLLENDTAAYLYHEHAAKMPIIDYHCHLSPETIATNHQFSNLSEIWLHGDHYKWRAMRTNGVDEAYCTGSKTDLEKFEKWAGTVPYTMRNPLYHWTHLELKRYFGIDTLLNADSAKNIYSQASEKLQSPGFRTWELLKKMKVEVVCTTDDPVDSLEHHQSYAKQNGPLTMLPTFRPDKSMAVEDPDFFNTYIDLLGKVTGKSIEHFIDLLDALKQRMDHFESLGCCVSDHGLERCYDSDFTDHEVNYIFQKIRLGGKLEKGEKEKYRSSLLLHLGEMYHEKGWVQQFHLGALRNNNSRMNRTLGPDSGFDSIGDFSQAQKLARFLDKLDTQDRLSKTILYNLNPRDNELLATMAGNFNDGSYPGKIQFGTSWWFLDQKDGMKKQMNALSNMGLISRFIGMLTDSRSFMSYPRHEYFRRILCNLFGRDIENGELPNDRKWIGKMVENICYYNAKEYFSF